MLLLKFLGVRAWGCQSIECGNSVFLMSEIIFEVQEDEVDGGFVATALGHAIVTQGDTLDELRSMVRDAVNCHFGNADKYSDA